MSHRDSDSNIYQPINTKSSTFSSSVTSKVEYEEMSSRTASLPSYLSHHRSHSEKVGEFHKAPAQTSIAHVESTSEPPTAAPPSSFRKTLFSSFSRSRSHSRSMSQTRSGSPKPVPDALDTTGIDKEAFLCHSGQRTYSPPPMSPDTMSPTSPAETSSKKKRHSSSYPVRHTSSDHKRLSGTVQHRGRHANDWLFGGFSVRDQVGKLWRDDGSDDDRDGK